MRSLEADGFRPSVIALLLAAVLLIGWLGWFVFGRITVFETAPAVSVSQTGDVVVDFPAEKRPLFHIGQVGWVRLTLPHNQPKVDLPVIVMDISPAGESVRLELYAVQDPTSPALANDLPAQVEIQVEKISPAKLVMRASGQFADTPRLSLNPQQLLQPDKNR